MGLLGKQSLFGMAVLAATGVPYAVHTATEDGKAENSLPELQAPLETGHVKSPAKPEAPLQHGAPRPMLPLEGPTVFNLDEIFNFDVSTAWVLGRWPRVLISGWGESWQTYRVPVVTGCRDHDLAGSLTYYFNPEQRVEWITFTGTTGDARPLVEFATKRLSLQRHAGKPGEYVYETRNDGEPESQLVIKPHPVQRADESHARFAVELRLKRTEESRPWYAPVDKKNRGVNLQ